MVIGPTPPGFGVILPAIGWTFLKSTSPTSFVPDLELASGTPGQSKHFLRLFWHLLQFGVEALQRLPQRIVFFAVFFQKIAPVLDGKPPVPCGQQRKKQRRMIAQAANRPGESG